MYFLFRPVSMNISYFLHPRVTKISFVKLRNNDALFQRVKGWLRVVSDYAITSKSYSRRNGVNNVVGVSEDRFNERSAARIKHTHSVE